MQDRTLAAHGGVTPSLRRVSRVAVVGVVGLLVVLLSAQTAQAGSSSMGLAQNAWIIEDLASEAQAAANAANGIGTGTARLGLPGTADGPPLGIPGTMDGPPARVSTWAKIGSKAARAWGWAGLLSTAAEVVIPWARDDATPNTYADGPVLPAEGSGTLSGSGTTTINARGWRFYSEGAITLTSASPTQPYSDERRNYYDVNIPSSVMTGFPYVHYDVYCRNGSTGSEFFLQAFTAVIGAGIYHLPTNVDAWITSVPECAPMDQVVGKFGPAQNTASAMPPSQVKAVMVMAMTANTALGPAPSAPLPAGDQPMTTTTTSTCSDGSSASATISYTANTAPKPNVVIPACPSGTSRSSVGQTTVTSDGRTVTDPAGDWTRPTVPAGFELCQTTACAVQLVQLTPGFGGASDSQPYVCNNTTGCEGALDPTKTPRVGSLVKIATKTGTGQTAAESTWAGTQARPHDVRGREYECRYGPYRVAVDECATVPIEAPTDLPSLDDSNCDLGDMSFSPVSWVVVPLKCVWIPRQSAVQSAFGTLSTKWAGTSIAAWATASSDLLFPFTTLADGTGCDGPTFTFTFMGPPWVLQPFAACTGVPAAVAQLFRLTSGALIYLSGGLLIVRRLGTSFGVEAL